MRILSLIFCLLSMVGVSLAKNHDFYFHEKGNDELCVSKTSLISMGKTAKGNVCLAHMGNDIRIRVANPLPSSTASYGIGLQRPFFILDGIYLDPEGRRTLSDFYDEANQFGIVELLSNLGYTPVLVQFAETVTESLEKNAEYFSHLLKFLNDNKFIDFPNKKEDGFIVLGISQGGILGRYGAYLYDSSRSSEDAPIRMYASMDSPHQGAVMPEGLFHTINFWATSGGSAAAERFRDLINGPGAKGLLLPQNDASGVRINMDNSRFLFADYRKAATYKGFPAVLISQGQMKGVSPKHASRYFSLNRSAEKLDIVLGRAVSRFNPSEASDAELAYNRIYQKFDVDSDKRIKGNAKFDFVQGSTYPFAETMYKALREGFLDAMPENMTMEVFSLFGIGIEMDINTKWNADSLIQKNSTFIPTVSALDLNCSGELAMRKDCAFTMSSNGFPFENPGDRSSAKAVYAVDQTHPRYDEAISGRHIEMPAKDNGTVDTAVAKGLQVDLWRVLCEIADQDYDKQKKAYRNEKLSGIFAPGASCMDISKMPEVIKASGLTYSKKFGYARYDYNKDATESDDQVKFAVPAGWHKVATFDNGSEIPDNGIFEVEVQVEKSNGNWLKAELLLEKSKSGSGQLQLNEISIPLDGKKHVVRWRMPSANGALAHYRWFRLVLNSDGSDVVVSEPRLVRTSVKESAPSKAVASKIYPNAAYATFPWTESTSIAGHSDAYGTGVKLSFTNIGSGMLFDFGEKLSMDKYSKLVVSYWPGTCQNTGVYFDSNRNGAVPLKAGLLSGYFVKKIVELKDLADDKLSVGNGVSASRLNFFGNKANESCLIHEISLE